MCVYNYWLQTVDVDDSDYHWTMDSGAGRPRSRVRSAARAVAPPAGPGPALLQDPPTLQYLCRSQYCLNLLRLSACNEAKSVWVAVAMFPSLFSPVCPSFPDGRARVRWVQCCSDPVWRCCAAPPPSKQPFKMFILSVRVLRCKIKCFSVSRFVEFL